MAESGFSGAKTESEFLIEIMIDDQKVVVQATPEIVEAMNSTDPMVRHHAYCLISNEVKTQNASPSVSLAPMAWPTSGLLSRSQGVTVSQQLPAGLPPTCSSVHQPGGQVVQTDSQQKVQNVQTNTTGISDTAGNILNTDEDSGRTYVFWPKEAILFLISLYKDYETELENPKQRKKDIWKVITSKMNQKGFNFSQNKVESKWRTLLQSYKEVNFNNSKSGSERKTCQYFFELDQLLSKRHDVRPKYTAGSGSKVKSSEVKQAFSTRASTDREESSSSSQGSDDPPAQKKRKNLTKSEETGQLLSYLKERDLQRKHDFEEKEKRRDERAREKNNLLGQILEILKK